MEKFKKRIYLICPKNPENFWTMKSSVEAVGAKTLMPNAAFGTLISLTPEELNIEYIYCDENIGPIDRHIDCDLVALTGYTLHSERIHEICAEFKKRGIPVALGGAFATLYPEKAEKICDYLFIHEAEYTWPEFLRDWSSGNGKSRYEQKKNINMKESPAPDWSFIRSKDYLYFPVQTSRGCPNNCDFCHAIKLFGRKYRSKSIEQIMIEIENAYKAGAETIFFSEDNFFVNKKFTVELLMKIIEWNTSIPAPVSFSAQATTGIGHDEEILKLLADARFSVIFLGVETIREECLKEVNKGHNIKFDARESVSNISKYGILPFIGLIVGFDHDDKKIFDELEGFLNDTGSPIASVSILNAPEGTTLYDRMKEHGRIIENFDGLWHMSTNIVPVSMSMSDLVEGHNKLFRRLYEPEKFEARVLKWLDGIEYFTPLYKNAKTNYSKIMKFFPITRYYIFREPRAVTKLYFRLLKKTWKNNPGLIKKTVTIMSQYCHYYDFANLRKADHYETNSA
ncbi:MAG: radical SAM protein [Spirochaetes bacterium]|nr:radical SAM protein [Spirochaetota bacterium]